MDNRTSDRDPGSNFLTRGLTIPAWLLLLVAVIAILAPVFRITIPDFVWALIALLLLLIGWLPRQGGSTPGASKELSDPDAPDYRMRISNFPNYANPTLLRIEDRTRLQGLNRELEIGSVTSVAGDLVFAVNRFDAPVRLVLNYTSYDEDQLNARKQELGSKDVELIPIYLHTPTTDEGGSRERIWRPFKDFTLDTDRKEATITVSSWGDSPTGWGTRP